MTAHEEYQLTRLQIAERRFFRKEISADQYRELADDVERELQKERG